MNKVSLVILAAGMGSRYGGLKQIDTVGNNGESIIHFTIYDAIKAGFSKVYLIIRKEHEAAFEQSLVHSWKWSMSSRIKMIFLKALCVLKVVKNLGGQPMRCGHVASK